MACAAALENRMSSPRKLSQQDAFSHTPPCKELPLEIWEKIAHVAIENSSNQPLAMRKFTLRSIAQVSRLHQAAAFSALNHLENEVATCELQKLNDLDPGRLDNKSDILDCYQSILHKLNMYQILTKDPKILFNIQQHLTAMCQEQVPKDLLSLHQMFLKQIQKERLFFKDIENAYAHLAEVFFMKALDQILSGCNDLGAARGYALIQASTHNLTNIVNMLLKKGPISQDDRGYAAGAAATHRNLAIVQSIIESGSISRHDTTCIFIDCVNYNRLELVKYLLENFSFGTSTLSNAIKTASKLGYVDIVKYIIEQNNVYIESRDEAIVQAAKKGFLDIIQILLQSKPKFTKEKDKAIFYAQQKGHHQIVELLINF